MVGPESNTSQAAYKTGKQEKAEPQSSNHTAVSCEIESKLLGQPLSLSLFSVRTRSIDMLMQDLPAEQLE